MKNGCKIKKKLEYALECYDHKLNIDAEGTLDTSGDAKDTAFERTGNGTVTGTVRNSGLTKTFPNVHDKRSIKLAPKSRSYYVYVTYLNKLFNYTIESYFSLKSIDGYGLRCMKEKINF